MIKSSRDKIYYYKMSTRISKSTYSKNSTIIGQMLRGKHYEYIDKSDDSYIIPLHAAIELGLKGLTPMDYESPKNVKLKPRPRQLEILNAIVADFKEIPVLSLSSDTGTGKTFMSLYLALGYFVPFMVIIPNSSLVEQWAQQLDRLRKFGDDRLFVGSTVKDMPHYKGQPMVIIAEWIVPEIPLADMEQYKLIIYDEAHKSFTNRAVDALMRCIGAERLLACTATIKGDVDSDNHKMSSFYGNYVVSMRVHVKYSVIFLNTNVCLRPYIEYVSDRNNTDDVPKDMTKDMYAQVLSEYADNPEHNERIARELVKYTCSPNEEPRKVLIISSRIRQCINITELLEEECIRVGVHKEESHFNYTTTFIENDRTVNGYTRFIAGTPQKVGCGFDLENATSGEYDIPIDTIVFLDSFIDEGFLQQAFGRAMRTDKPILIIWIYFPFKISTIHKLSFLEFKKGDKYIERTSVSDIVCNPRIFT